MNMQISLRVKEPANPIRHVDDVPIYPMGYGIGLVAEFTNKSAVDVNIEDPKTSQKVLLWVLMEGEVEEDVFEINPGSIDITGERTAPLSGNIIIRSKETISLSFKLYKYCLDGCFIPGKYELHLEFLEMKSPLIKYGIEFHPESVQTLIDIALDETGTLWLREESLIWLRKMPEKPNIELPIENESETEKENRELRNRENARLFLEHWPNKRETKAVKDFFEEIRLK